MRLTNVIYALFLTVSAGGLLFADPCDGIPKVKSTISFTCTKIVISDALPTDPTYVHIVASSSDPSIDTLRVEVSFNPVVPPPPSNIPGPVQESGEMFEAKPFPRPLKADKVVKVPAGYFVIGIAVQEITLKNSTGFGD
jgi:hypothetical protein